MSTRDLPHSFSELSYGWVKRIRAEFTVGKSKEQLLSEDYHSTTDEDSEVVTSVKANSLWPAFASGAGLFSDGYVNNSISTVLFCLKKIYPDEITKSNAINNIASIAFVGTVVGQLGFGYISDRIARKGGMMAANVMLIFFHINVRCRILGGYRPRVFRLSYCMEILFGGSHWCRIPHLFCHCF